MHFKRLPCKVSMHSFITSLICITVYSSHSQSDPRNEAEPWTTTCHSQGCLHTYIIRLHRPWLRDPQCCKIFLSFFLCLFLPLARSHPLPAELKERRFYLPADLWYTPFLRLHASYITRLKQGCCNERYLEGTQSLRKSSICYRKDCANPQLKAKIQHYIKNLCISSSHINLIGHYYIFKSPRNGGNVA